MPARSNSAYIHIEENDDIIYVNRTMPNLVEDQFTKEEWKSFCNELDEALVPANQFRKNGKIFLQVFVLNFLLLIVNIVVTETLLHSINSPSTKEISSADIFMFCHLIFTIVITIFFFTYVIIWHCSTKPKTEREIRKACNACAEPKPALNFCVMTHSATRQRFISLYIEVTVGNEDSIKNILLVPHFKASERTTAMDAYSERSNLSTSIRADIERLSVIERESIVDDDGNNNSERSNNNNEEEEEPKTAAAEEPQTPQESSVKQHTDEAVVAEAPETPPEAAVEEEEEPSKKDDTEQATTESTQEAIEEPKAEEEPEVVEEPAVEAPAKKDLEDEAEE